MPYLIFSFYYISVIFHLYCVIPMYVCSMYVCSCVYVHTFVCTGSSCHQVKFLVCVNILGNNALTLVLSIRYLKSVSVVEALPVKSHQSQFAFWRHPINVRNIPH